MNDELPIDSLGESGQTDGSASPIEFAKPTDAARSMVEKDSFHASVVADPRKPMSPIKTNTEAASSRLDGVCSVCNGQSTESATCRNLGILGTSESAEASKVCTEINPAAAPNLRAVDICRLLNSTPLGTVLDERQLYRHRLRAGSRIQEGRRINLLRYAAWLSEVRHSRIDERVDPNPQPGPVTATKVLKLLELQHYRCALTGRKLVPSSAALDHVLPISRNGTNNIENAQILDSDVNRAKGALTNEEFVLLCREVANWAERPISMSHRSNVYASSPSQMEEPNDN